MTQSFIKITKISLKMETITLRCQARTKDKGNEVIYRNELLLATYLAFASSTEEILNARKSLKITNLREGFRN